MRIEFFIRLCHDVLLDVLRWGDRYQLADLEKNGRRFYCLIDGYFKKAPFLRLDLKVFPRYLYFTFPVLNSDGFRIYDHCDF